MEKAAAATRPELVQQDAADEGDVLLLYSTTPTERELVEAWRRRSGYGDGTLVAAETPALADIVARGPDSRRITPVRVAWLPPNGRTSASIRDLLVLRDPRRPAAGRQAKIAATDPDRFRVLAGAPARLGELRGRFSSGDGDSLERFIERQGVIALERAERELIGGKYKVPRLVAEELIASGRFNAMVARLARAQDRDVDEVRREAAAALEEMVASQSRLAIDAWDQFGRWVARAYELDVDTTGLDELKRLNESNPLVFLPSHRSYLDTLVLRPVLHRLGFPPNHVLGGANLDFWPIGPVARRNGYVFIRRSMKGADVYKAVLREYLGYLLTKRFNLEWYLEGGRSRTGKLRPPRYGILNYLVEAFRETGIDDVQLVPVSVVYDQLHEVGAMAAEEHGAKKQAEGLRWIVEYTRAQARPFGAVHVGFGEPLSLREALADDGSVPKIAFEVLNRVNAVAPITSSSILALAMLDGRDMALTFDQGRERVRPIIAYADQRGLPKVAGIELGQTTVIRKALQTLVRERVVTEYTGGTEPVWRITPGKHVEAAFYRNNSVHHFVTRAMTELALLHVAEGNHLDPAEEVWQETLRLRDLLKFEFFFPRKRVFADDVRTEGTILAPGWEQRTGDSSEVRAVLEHAPVLLAPRVLGCFVEAYSVAADELAAHDPREPIDENKFKKHCVGVAHQRVMMGRLKTPECASKELFAGALRLAGNRDLVDPGRDELRDRRAELAAEVADVRRRIDELRLVEDARLEARA
jgi:glycerol-3-phosphate O-acyltransferase